VAIHATGWDKLDPSDMEDVTLSATGVTIDFGAAWPVPHAMLITPPKPSKSKQRRLRDIRAEIPESP
jgi:hypothetical protein